MLNGEAKIQVFFFLAMVFIYAVLKAKIITVVEDHTCNCC